MSSSGGTTIIPIVGGVGTGLDVASALPATWLSLKRYAKIVGIIAPPHFWGGQVANIWPVNECAVVVPRHGWQYTEVVSREEITEAILLAEKDISEIVGFHLAPTYIKDEVHQFPRPYDPLFSSAGGINTTNIPVSIKPKTSKILQGGVRAVTKIGTATIAGGSLTYTDEDGDGFAETATVTFPTTESLARELKVYITDTLGVPEWEIRDPKRKRIEGGSVIFEFGTWQFVNPDIDARPPGTEYRALDLTDPANLLTSVDIYREYIDNTVASARFFWENVGTSLTAGVSTDVGALTYQDGVVTVRDVHSGLLVPRAATYNATDGIWAAASWTVGRDPDQVSINYYAGDVSQTFLDGRSFDPLKDKYAKAIAYLATARLSRSICPCKGVLAFFDSLQQDLALATSGESYNLSFGDLDNPFGTRRGEIMAWRLIGKKNRETTIEVAVL
jgi:hypothetical protein